MISSLFVEVRMLVGILFGKLTINSHKNIAEIFKIIKFLTIQTCIIKNLKFKIW